VLAEFRGLHITDSCSEHPNEPSFAVYASKKIEDASLVVGSYEISESGKTMRFFKLKAFDIHLSPNLLKSLSETIPIDAKKSRDSE